MQTKYLLKITWFSVAAHVVQEYFGTVVCELCLYLKMTSRNACFKTIMCSEKNDNTRNSVAITENWIYVYKDKNSACHNIINSITDMLLNKKDNIQ